MSKQKVEPKQIKKVKIHEHIAATKKTGNPEVVRGKRGRPRKDSSESSRGALPSNSGTNPPLSTANSQPGSESTHFGTSQPLQVVPVHDTTGEARAFLEAPFSIVAGFTGIPKLALYPTQLDALAPSFKPIYDKYIIPSLGENAMLYAFGLALSGVVAEKVMIFAEEKKKNPPKAETVTPPPASPTIENVAVQ